MCALAAALHRLSLRCLHPEFHVWPDRRAAAGALGKNSRDDTDLYLAQYRRAADLARCWRPVTSPPRSAISRQNQDARRERQNSHYDRRDGNVKQKSDSGENQVNCPQEHSEIFGDVHGSFLRQTVCICTLKKNVSLQ